MSQIVIFADDLTGAADATAPFSKRGLMSILCLQVRDDVQADVFTVVTHSRLSVDLLAVEQHRSVVQAAQNAGLLKSAPRIYQKIDSTLRGYPAQILNATMDMTNMDKALVTPTFPEQGRTMRNGRVFLNGKPLSQSEFGKAIESDDLITLFKQQVRPAILIDLDCVKKGIQAIVAVMQKHASAIFVADAETREDLASLSFAAEKNDIHLLCGSAGLAGELAQRYEQKLTSEIVLPKHKGPVLAVSGSRHPIMAQQVQTIKKMGIDVVPGHDRIFHNLNNWMQCVKQESCRLLKKGVDIVVTTAGLAIGPQSAAISSAVGTTVKEILNEERVGGLFLTGGNVAQAICEALESSKILLVGQVEAGVVVGRFLDGRYSGLFVVTKAGGFGHQNTLLQSIQYLKNIC